jgi:hypothetical protein
MGVGMGAAAGSEPISDPRLPGPADGFALAASTLRQAITSGDDDLLSHAVARCRRALAATPRDDNERRSKTLSMLGVALAHRFRRHGAMADIDEAVEVGRRGADLLPDGDPDQFTILVNLAGALKLRFDREGAALGKRDLDAAVVTFRRAAAAVPSGSLQAASVGYGLCTTLIARFDSYGDTADLTEAVSTGREVADALVAAGQVSAAAQLTERTVAGLAGLPPDRLDSAQGRQSLRWFAGLAAAAASLALLDDKPGKTESERAELAFCLLEAGRGSLLWHSLRVGRPGPRAVPAPADLHSWAGSGSVAAISVSRYRGDALVLAGGTVTCVPLPGLSQASLAGQVALFDRSLARVKAGGWLSEPSGPNRDLSGILEWLWDTIAWPVLDRLGCTGTTADPASLTRIWWMPTGALCRLPLHAAGHHREGGGRTLLDRVVSSYTPTVHALGQARASTGSAADVVEPDGEAGRLLAMLPESPEPLHLTSALQLAGFAQVTGTLWEAGESSAAVRKRLVPCGGRRGSLARAMHAAVRRLRDEGSADLPLTWAGFVHAGI